MKEYGYLSVYIKQGLTKFSSQNQQTQVLAHPYTFSSLLNTLPQTFTGKKKNKKKLISF